MGTSATLRFQTRQPDTGSVKAVADTGTYPSDATVRAASPVAVDSDGYAEVTASGPFEANQIFFVKSFPYETATGGGSEGPVFAQPFVKRPHPLLVDFTCDLYVDYDDVLEALVMRYRFHYRVHQSPLVKSLNFAVFTADEDVDITPGVDGSHEFYTHGLLSWNNYGISVTGYDDTGGEAGTGNAGPTARENVGDLGYRGLMAKAADGVSPNTVTQSDRIIFTGGLKMVENAEGRAEARLKYTLSTSAPSGTPEDGELWFRYS